MSGFYAHANLEVPQWGEMLGIDPRTKEEVWDPVLDEDGRQVSVKYMRGQQVDQAKFREQDWNNYMEWGAIAEGQPEAESELQQAGIDVRAEDQGTSGGEEVDQ